MSATTHALDLGPYTLSLLSRVAPPALALDRVDRVELDERGSKIVARRTVTLGDPMVAGHFTHLPVLPSTAVLESLVQAGGLLLGFLLAIRAVSGGADEARALCERLRAFDRRARLLPVAAGAADAGSLRDALSAWGGSVVRTSVPAGATVKFRRAVVPGDTMVVSLRAVREVGDLWHCEGEITVDSQLVLDGTIVLLVRELPIPARELNA